MGIEKQSGVGFEEEEMGSSHFGDLSLGRGRSGSSKRGKKSNLEKPKHPQRGLGVAQLEMIRLKNQMSNGYLPLLQGSFHSNLCKEVETVELALSPSPSSSCTASSSSPFGPTHPNIMMRFEDLERREIRYGDPQSGFTTRFMSDASNSTCESLNFAERKVTLPLLRQPLEDWVKKKRRQDRCDLMGSSSQNSDSSAEQELDLDLKLSL